MRPGIPGKSPGNSTPDGFVERFKLSTDVAQILRRVPWDLWPARGGSLGLQMTCLVYGNVEIRPQPDLGHGVRTYGGRGATTFWLKKNEQKKQKKKNGEIL